MLPSWLRVKESTGLQRAKVDCDCGAEVLNVADLFPLTHNPIFSYSRPTKKGVLISIWGFWQFCLFPKMVSYNVSGLT